MTSTAAVEAAAREALRTIAVYSAPEMSAAQKPLASMFVATCPTARVVGVTVLHGVDGTSTSAESDFPPAVATMYVEPPFFRVLAVPAELIETSDLSRESQPT
jgi:hypothetical protein